MIPPALDDYVSALINLDIAKISRTIADDLLFISATRMLGKSQFLDLLSALYTGFPDWTYEYTEIEDRSQNNYAIKWRQSGTHTGIWTMPGMDPVIPTGRRVVIPAHYFYYRVAGNKLALIFPEPVVGGAPRGILEQIGVDVPPL